MNLFGEYVYHHSLLRIVAFDQQGLQEAFAQIQSCRDRGYLLGYVAYEAYYALIDETYRSKTPLLFFECFAHREAFTSLPKTHKIFAPQEVRFVDYESYAQQVEAIKEQILEGNTYQGNLTTCFEFVSTLELEEIFAALLYRQDTPYRAFLDTPYGKIASFSPELFFEIKGGRIYTEPMKGTIGRGADTSEDQRLKEFLQSDIKNRSENVMIVDLLRNDLSRIATEVEVLELFAIKTYPTLFQMTSKIAGKLKDNATLLEIFTALFPCGSITGAPKKRTIEILQGIENRERGVYCGAIGLIESQEMTFSIPIRTLVQRADQGTFKQYAYGVGSGIVWDSDPWEEYQELQIKKSFLFEEFELVETMRYDDGIALLDLHLQRLQRSAKSLGFCYCDGIEEHLRSLRFSIPHKIRLKLSRNGSFVLENSPITPIVCDKIEIAKRIGGGDLIAHKTTLRPYYADVAARIARCEVFDVVFCDEEGRLLEGSRSNVYLEIDGKLLTPKSHILPGVYRQHLIEQGRVQEEELWVCDLQRAERVFCSNAVCGLLEVVRVGGDPKDFLFELA